LPRRSGGYHRSLSSAAESALLSAFSSYGGGKMKISTVFLALVLLFALASCGDDFDAEAERETLEDLSKEYYKAYEVQDMEVHKRLEDDEDFELFVGNFGWQGTATAEDTVPDPAAVGTDITIESREWMIAPGLAVARSHETWEWPNGYSGEFLLTLVWEKKDDQWYLVHAHMSEY
jgi:hypothetical protein